MVNKDEYINIFTITTAIMKWSKLKFHARKTTSNSSVQFRKNHLNITDEILNSNPNRQDFLLRSAAQFWMFLVHTPDSTQASQKLNVVISMHCELRHRPLPRLRSAHPVVSAWCSTAPFTETRDQFFLGNSAINLLAPQPFQLLSISIKAQSTFDNTSLMTSASTVRRVGNW